MAERNIQNKIYNLESVSTYDAVFACLMDAIIENSSVEIEYTNQRNETIVRTIHPKRFELIKRFYKRMSRLCISAYCEIKQEERVFALMRINELRR